MQSFAGSLSESQICALGGNDKKTIIFEAELLALVVSINLWRPLFGGSPTVFYVDNNSARDVAISGCGHSLVANDPWNSLLEEEMKPGVFAWYGRVPSPSNPADEPSRNPIAWKKAFGPLVVDVGEWLNAIFLQLTIYIG